MGQSQQAGRSSGIFDQRGAALVAGPGVRCLAEAWDEACRLGAEVWQTAVEVELLHSLGLTNHDLRTLMARGLAQHAVETTHLRDRSRRFNLLKLLFIPQNACFVLTPAGRDWAAQAASPPPAVRKPVPAVDRRPRRGGKAARGTPEPPAAEVRLAPWWNKKLHELWLGDVLVKRFTQRAPLQERILTEFQDLDWPEMILDPLPPQPGQVAAQRLHHVVAHLNAAHQPCLIRFFVNDGGRSVHWEPVVPRL